MKLLTIILLWTVAAQGAVDLAGEWRRHDGDDPRWAAPDFDDRHWSRVTLPFTPAIGPAYWLRRQVVLDETLEEPGLALGMFALRYEVYLDGVKVAVARPSAASAYFWPRWFALATGPRRMGTRLTLALRVEGSALTPLGLYRGLPDLGPYLLASRQGAQAATEFVWLRHRHALLPTELTAFTLLLLVLLLAMVWMSGVRRPELAWFAGFLLFIGCFNWAVLASAYQELDRSWVLVFGPVAIACLGTSLARLTGDSARLPWILAGASSVVMTAWWVTGEKVALPLGLFTLTVSAGYVPIIIWIARAWRQHRPVRMVALPVSAYLALTFNAYLEAAFAGWPLRSSSLVGPFQLNLATAVSAGFGMAVSMMLIRNAARERREAARLTGEMDAARRVQQFLISAAATPGINAVYLPAAEVGGDFYQAFPLAEGGTLVAVGDVSGKGLKAAMVVSMVTGVLRSRRSDDPAALLAELNRALAGSLDSGFVTALIARLDRGGRATLANAGHPAPYLDGVEVAVEAGLPLGLTADAEYSNREIQTKPGQQLTFVSDGVVEAENAARELFGFERMRALSAQSAQAIAEAAKQWGQNDDITVVTVRSTS